MTKKRIVFGVFVVLIVLTSFLAGQEMTAGNQAEGAAVNSPKLVWDTLENGRLSGRTYRAKIPGGWLLTKNSNDTGITFVPDPQHKWDGNSLP
jgi:hypothetical protein